MTKNCQVRPASASAGAGQAAHSRELAGALAAAKQYIAAAAAFSVAVNILHLAPALYMMQIYDRVIPSSSAMTLALLTVVLLLSLATIGILDSIRAKILARAGLVFDARLAARVVEASVYADPRDRSQPALKAFETVRQFASGPGIQAFFDLPWLPIYILILGLLHPAFAMFAVIAAALVFGLSVLQDRLTRAQAARGGEGMSANTAAAECVTRNGHAVRSMGLLPGYLGTWRSDRDLALVDHQRGAERTVSLQSLAKAGRVALQSLMLGLGAWLVVEQAAGAGVMFAASLLLGRALQPVEQIAASYRGIQGARAAWSSLDALLESSPPQIHPAGPASFQPTGLTVEGVSVMLPAAQRPLLYNINLQVMPGEIVVIVGPTGAGKSLLAGVIAGAVSPTMGTVRLHGMSMSGPRHGLGPRIGYLADEPALLPGTIVENISRFRNAAPAEIVAAASMAGAHEMILRLPMGYETVLSEGAGPVSAGLRQRIALARAFFGNPGLLVLDGPESRLDSLAEAALPSALLTLRTRRVCTVVVTHRPSILAIADRIVLMRGATIAVQGPPEVVLRSPGPARVTAQKRA